jgi:hypothetical protein
MAERMRLPWREDFEHVGADGERGRSAPGRLARYFSDINGAFETAPCGGYRQGTCYRQVVDRKPIAWNGAGSLAPTTVAGDPRWSGDYDVSARARLDAPGSVQLLGRVDAQKGTRVSGYHLEVSDSGEWRLFAQDLIGPDAELASGRVTFGIAAWHRLALRFRGAGIDVRIDGRRVAQVRDTRHLTGQIGLGGGDFSRAEFDDVSVTPSGPAPRLVPHAEMTATATSAHTANYRGYEYSAPNAIDDRPETMWNSEFSPPAPLPQAITLDLGGVYDLTELRYRPRFDGNLTGNITAYTVAASGDGTTFSDVASGTWSEDDSVKVATFDAKDVRALRLTATGGRLDLAAVAELVPLGTPVDVPEVSATALSAPMAIVAGRRVDVPVSVGNWTAEPLEVEASVTVPGGWKTEPQRAVVPPGSVIPVNVGVTPPAGFPSAGLQPEMTLTGHARPVGGGESDGAPTATTWVAPDPSRMELALDSGTTTGQLMPGWARLSAAELWTDGATAGWVGTPPDSRDRGIVDVLRRDFTLSRDETTLRLAVPPGIHDVALLRGDANGSSGSTIVELDGATLVPAGGNLRSLEFAWERFTLDGGALGRTADLKISNDTGAYWRIVALVMAPKPVNAESGVGGTVPATLSLTLGGAASFGTFVPGVARTYRASTTANVISTAADAALTVSDPSTNHPGHLVNGPFAMPQPLQGLGTIKTWSAPVANDAVAVEFEQAVAASDALRTGSYSKTLTFTVSTTTP